MLQFNCFNSLQTGKRIQRVRSLSPLRSFGPTCFNSLQTGKRIQSLEKDGTVKAVRVMFQFPSNGKAYPKLTLIALFVMVMEFQFPSNGKAYPKNCCWALLFLVLLRFNSLQTGKRIQRTPPPTTIDGMGGVSIPFKRESVSKVRTERLWHQYPRRFNSLQTGKRIQRDPILIPVGPWLRTPKTKRELRGAIFERNFSPKIPQTHVCIDPNAIFS